MKATTQTSISTLQSAMTTESCSEAGVGVSGWDVTGAAVSKGKSDKTGTGTGDFKSAGNYTFSTDVLCIGPSIKNREMFAKVLIFISLMSSETPWIHPVWLVVIQVHAEADGSDGRRTVAR